MFIKHLISLFLLLSFQWAYGQGTDSFALQAQRPEQDSAIVFQQKTSVNEQAARVIATNKFLNIGDRPRLYPAPLKQVNNTHSIVFFVLVGVTLLLAILRNYNPSYFNTLFRVFLNPAARQNQLMDKLLQTKQFSLLYNSIFIFVFGILLYFVLQRLGIYLHKDPSVALLLCVALVLAVYLIKFVFITFVGWLSQTKKEAALYAFNVFNVNKIGGIMLVPLMFFVAFSLANIALSALVLAIILFSVMLLTRVVRGFNIIHQNLRWSFLPYFFCFLAFEILPVVILVKFGIRYFS